MKLDGVLILRITDFRKYFDFSSFWQCLDEFIGLVRPYSVLDDFFFDTPFEKQCCAVFYRCLKRYDNLWTEIRVNGNEGTLVSSVADNCIQRMLEPLVWKLDSRQVDLYTMLERKTKNRYVVLELFSLYMMLGYVPKEEEVDSVLDIVGGREASLADRVLPLREDIVLQTYKKLETPEFPLEIKTLVNRGDVSVKVSLDRDMAGNMVVLKPGECVNGIFHGNKCYKLLSRQETRGGYDFRLLYNDKSRGTDLQIREIVTGKSRTVAGVVSFFADSRGYAYVNADGRCTVYRLGSIESFLNKIENGLVLSVSVDDNGIVRVVKTNMIY